MTSLNDVLKDVLEKDFDEETVEKVIDADEEPEREQEPSEYENDSDPGYAGPDATGQYSVGRGAVEGWIKNSIYEKYNISSMDMKAFSKMSPVDMLSDFGKTVGDIGRLRADLNAGKISSAEFKSAMSKTKGEIVGKMLEMGSSRKSILEDSEQREVCQRPKRALFISTYPLKPRINTGFPASFLQVFA